MTGFEYEIRDRGNGALELLLMGYMDEQTELPAPSRFKNCQRLIINFRQIKSILSIGIKNWIKFTEPLENIPNLIVDFKDCSKQVVDQINLVDGFLPKNARVQSIFIPVYCEKCNRSFKVLRSTENIKMEIHEVIRTMEKADCEEFPQCKVNFELEVNPVSYLKFLER